MWCSDRRRLLLAFACLAGCGFEPLYAPGSPPAAMRGRIAFDSLEGSAGFTLTERLLERLGWPDRPTHRLELALDFEEEGIAITPGDITTRFRVYGVAAYRLVPNSGGEPALEGEVQSFTGYNAPATSTASAFASRVAAEDARVRLARLLADRIVLDLALTAGNWLR
jgi:LPS-assembly lipoprotein